MFSEGEYMDAHESDDNVTLRDCEVLINAYIQANGFYSHQTPSYDDFLKNGIPYILKRLFTVRQLSFENQRRQTELDKKIRTIEYEGVFTDVTINPRSEVRAYHATEKTEFMDPISALRNNKTLKVNINASMLFNLRANLHDGTTITRIEKVEGLTLGGIAVPVFSEFTKFFNRTPELLFAHGWDPHDIGCQVIIGGKKIIFNISEETIFNKVNIYRNHYKHELTRAQLVSRDGDSFENSAEVIVRHFDNDIITVMIKIYETKIHIPIYSMMRLLGVPNDKTIVDSILLMPKMMYSDIERKMLQILDRCFTAPLEEFDDLNRFRGIENCKTTEEIVQFLTRINIKAKDEQVERYFNNEIQEYIDTNLLPHLGQKPEARILKARYLGVMVNKMLMMSMDIIEPNDRDSTLQKRFYSCGTSLTKQFKHEFNKGFIKHARNNLRTAFINNEFDKVNVGDVMRSTLKNMDFERHMIRAMRTAEYGDEAEKGNTQQRNRNHLRTEPDAAKSKIFTHAATLVCRSKNLASKTSERSDLKRRVHPTTLGYICPGTSADTGEKVGNVKHLTITAQITRASSSFVLKTKILSDQVMPVTPLLEIPPDAMYKYARVYVNGNMIGGIPSGKVNEFIDYYREERRHKRIDRDTTIYWEFIYNEIEFWVDFGRLIRPLLIVYRNPQTGRQHTKFTRKVRDALLGGTMTFNDLIDAGIMEMVSAEEELNLLVAENINTLKRDAECVLKRYTHCDIDLAVFGLLALATPFMRHSQTQRTTYVTNQLKQAYGLPMNNWPFIMVKQLYIQHTHQVPIVSTFTSRHMFLGGRNAVVAFTTLEGQGLEDSALIKMQYAQSGGHRGFYMETMTIEKMQNEEFGITTRDDTMRHKSRESGFNPFEHIEQGTHYAKIGAVVQQGHVIVAKFRHENGKFVDTSEVYDKSEPSIVDDVIPVTQDDDNKIICKITLRMDRSICYGDKIAATSGNKSVVGEMRNTSDMPYTASGVTPDIIINGHSFPKRMINGQAYDLVTGKYAAVSGQQISATLLDEIDIDQIYMGLLEEQYTSEGFKIGFKLTPEIRRELQAEMQIENLEKYEKILEKGQKDDSEEYKAFRRTAFKKLYDATGVETMYDGKTGKKIKCKIFIGINWYMRLEKDVDDTKHAIHYGPTNPLTRQVVPGRKRNGGLRLGEMEKDNLIAGGAIFILGDKLYNSNTTFYIYVCFTCYNLATGGPRPECTRCKHSAIIYKVKTCFTTNTVLNMIRAMCIKPELHLVPPLDYTPTLTVIPDDS
jgi:DNA-directed RNA polymerase beta subunit